MIKKIAISIVFSGILVANTFTDSKRKLMWQDNAEAKTVQKDWQGAIDYCENLSLAGFKDWRLPKHNELRGITDKTKIDPAIKKGFKNVVSDFYWSSSSTVYTSDGAWNVNFKAGNDYYAGKSDNYYVRCVRDSK
jgi:hypothetical protein